MKDTGQFRVRSRELLLHLEFLDVTTRTIASPNGATFERIVIEHPGAVAVVPLVGDSVALIRQYRAAASDTILEIPAGKLDRDGEDREDAARRELAEETGYLAGSLTHLTDLWTSIGVSDERICIFCTDDLQPGTPAPIGPEENAAEVILMPFDEALDQVSNGTISDAKTVVGLLFVARNRATS
ncbi:MAG: NUDIX hydrolase [Acidimicrobiia bacterium]|nr:MAG: NUDIX hydrolase [Acidimicrobiia bacterium]